jgi:hypothetical protein
MIIFRKSTSEVECKEKLEDSLNAHVHWFRFCVKSMPITFHRPENLISLRFILFYCSTSMKVYARLTRHYGASHKDRLIGESVVSPRFMNFFKSEANITQSYEFCSETGLSFLN